MLQKCKLYSVIMPVHNIPPVYNEKSSCLVLGSFPSVKSRSSGFFYGHPRNRFWRMIAAVAGEPVPQTTEEKKSLLLRHGIALWDVLESCEIKGSADSSIKAAVPNDIGSILNGTGIKIIFLNGNTAWRFYNRYIAPSVKIPAVKLPSTSPANASYTLDMLINEWGKILKPYMRKL